MRAFPFAWRSHGRLDGAGGALRETEYPRGIKGTSKETELKLTNVARASLEELLADYEDFLRSKDGARWDKDSREAKFVRKLGGTVGVGFEAFREFVETRPAEVVANIALCLIHQANFLLDQ